MKSYWQNCWNCCKKRDLNYAAEDPTEMEQLMKKRESHPDPKKQSNGFVHTPKVDLRSSNCNSITSEIIEEDSVTTSPDTATLEEPVSLIQQIVNEIIDEII